MMLKLALLHHRVSGDEQAPPVLFLHGFLGAGSDWKACIAALGNQCRCITLDLPGHGQSVGMRSTAYTFPGCTRALIAVLDQLGIERCNVVGYSMGGRVALRLANKFPSRVNKLVLESSSPGLRTREERQARIAHDERLAHDLETGDFATFLQRWYAQPLFSTLATDRERLDRIVAERRHNDPQELARALRGLGTGAQPSLWTQLPTLAAPMLLMVGEHDAKFRALAGKMAALQPRAHVAVVPNAGHNVHEEQPDVFVQIVSAFLAEDAPF